MNNGWIKLHRKLLDNPIMKKSSWVHLWVVLLMLANHDDEHKFIWNGKDITLKKGQFVTGRKVLSEQTGIPETTIERILDYLQNSGQIGQQKTTKYRLITIVKWNEYQEVDNKRTTNGQQTDTFKKLRSKEYKNKDIATGVADDPIKPLKEEETMKLEDFVKSMRASPQRYIRLIGEYADEIKPSFTTKAQWKVFTSRNLRPAKDLEPFTDEQIEKALNHIEKNKKSAKNPKGFITEWTLETLLKYITK